MLIPWLSSRLAFPPPERANRDGILAVGGDCTPERLLVAYRQGIFPWPLAEGLPLFWFSPDPRFVLEPQRAHLGRTLRKQLHRGLFEVRVDTAFARVIRGCAGAARPAQEGTWITQDLRQGYEALHGLGYAHSVEAWREGRLVGGLYGVSLGRVFYGESMFALEPDASKVAFATLLGNLVAWGFALVDCQAATDHLSRFGAEEWPRPRFLQALQAALEAPDRVGPWRFDLGPEAAGKLIVDS